eukprot:gene19975-6881_t
MKLKLLVALVLVTAVRGYAACSDDEGCSLNASVQGAYGDELPPKNVTSWGGNAIYNGSAW